MVTVWIRMHRHSKGWCAYYASSTRAIAVDRPSYVEARDTIIRDLEALENEFVCRVRKEGIDHTEKVAVSFQVYIDELSVYQMFEGVELPSPVRDELRALFGPPF